MVGGLGGRWLGLVGIDMFEGMGSGVLCEDPNEREILEITVAGRTTRSNLEVSISVT